MQGFKIKEDREAGHILIYGDLDIYRVSKARKILNKAISANHSIKAIDLSELTKLDTVGAMLIKQLQDKYKIKVENLRDDYTKLFDMVAKMHVNPPKTTKRRGILVRAINSLGERFINIYREVIAFTAFLGEACSIFTKSLLSVKHLRFSDIMHHIEETGIHAIPIISIMAFMIAIVLAYQGVAQLKPLGVENLTVNLVAISVLREMGVLLTSIMVAGRSGSAFTAEIGVMKVGEEVDALKVIGINPFEVLVLPRMICADNIITVTNIFGGYNGISWRRGYVNVPNTYSINHLYGQSAGSIKKQRFYCWHGESSRIRISYFHSKLYAWHESFRFG